MLVYKAKAQICSRPDYLKFSLKISPTDGYQNENPIIKKRLKNKIILPKSEE